MPLCVPQLERFSAAATYFPEAYPSDRVVLLTSTTQGREDFRQNVNEEEPIIGRGGPQNVTYRGIMTHDAYFELYEKRGEDPATAEIANTNNVTFDEEDLGTLVWRFGRAPFEIGVATMVMQVDGNLVFYAWSPGENRPLWGTSGECFVFDNGVNYYDNFYLAWIPEENQAAVFPGYWDENLPRVWSSSQGFANLLPYKPEDYDILNPCSRTSSALSLIGSILVLYMIVGQRIKQKKWSNTKDRILVGVCLLDLFFSVGLGIGTAATPPDFYGVVGAMGNVRFCEAQGFMIQLGMAVPMYYCGLSLVFLLYVTKGKGIRFVEKWIEPIVHVLVWTVALSTAIAGLVTELYNSNGQFCYIEPYPYNCDFEQYVDCTRGEDATTFLYVFGAGLVAVPYFGTTILMTALYYAVWDQDHKLRKRYGNLWNGNMDRLKKIKIQAFLYIGGFFVVWIWTSIRLILEMLGIESPFWLEAVATFTLPLQGFFNFMIFVRQPIARTHKDHPERSCIWVVLSAIKDYPFAETEQQSRNASRRRSSIRAQDTSATGKSRDSRDLSQKSRDGSTKSLEDGEPGNFFSNSRLFVLGKGPDQEGAC